MSTLLNTRKAAGLPNVIQYIGRTEWGMSTPPTAYYEHTAYNATFMDTNYGGAALAYISIVLSHSNSIYGNSTTVSPLSTSTLMLMKY